MVLKLYLHPVVSARKQACIPVSPSAPRPERSIGEGQFVPFVEHVSLHTIPSVVQPKIWTFHVAAITSAVFGDDREFTFRVVRHSSWSFPIAVQTPLAFDSIKCPRTIFHPGIFP